MWKHWLGIGLGCLLAFSANSQEPAKEPSVAAPAIDSVLVDRLFEMAEQDGERDVRVVALHTCSTLPDQQPRFAATIDRMLDSPDRAIRFDAVRYLDTVDLPAERKVAAAVRHMRDVYSETNVIRYNIRGPGVSSVLTQHSEVALQVIVEHLTSHGDLPVLYLDMADHCGIDIEKHSPLLIEYSRSEDAAVRQRLAELLSNRLRSHLSELERQQKAVSAGEQASQQTSAKYLDFSLRIISRYDLDQSGSLQKEEWGKMLTDPAPADRNGDGEITAQEYRDYLLKKRNH